MKRVSASRTLAFNWTALALVAVRGDSALGSAWTHGAATEATKAISMFTGFISNTPTKKIGGHRGAATVQAPSSMQAQRNDDSAHVLFAHCANDALELKAARLVPAS
jgi:hypothetical protein